MRVTDRGDNIVWSVQQAADPATGVAGKTVSQESPPIIKDSAWFAFAASPDSIWVYDGAKGLTVLDFRKGASPSLTNADLPSGWADPALKDPPKEVVERLPVALRFERKDQK